MNTLIKILEFVDLFGVPSLFMIICGTFLYIRRMCFGIRALLRSTLYDLYDTWAKRGYAPRDVKSNFESVYTWYHALGKNGVMTRKYEIFMTLPDEKEINNE